ncbi:ABC transporter substrate-binding protein [Frigidibacter sp. ROC022]|uniref:ABC transporter substrate-binding protein n=1 Tax=Frigidibacter sp. ROC022 TaxID=2971796 RepID=UPI00215B141C|nr:ABC transporter substrate-binding protein [Frigidibacter sp. ROC022]MCR8725652.1 ABC transporter substrate-binding protein [Frigidibacter sp. ROC022]
MTMRNLTACLLGTAFAVTAFAPAYAADTDIIIVLNEELESIDPCMASKSNIGRVILQNISETMTELSPTEGLKPRLADSWEDMGDGTWRFHLHPGVTFSDGTTLDAGDVKHSMERVVSTKISCEIGAKYFGGIKVTPTVVDDLTIDLKADPPQPILPLLMSTLTIVPAETPEEFVQNPIGTGPYVLTEWKAGQSIVLDRRDDYWGAEPEVTKATYLFRTDDAVRAAMVKTGEADISPVISELDATDPATDFSYPNSETTYLRIDQGVAPLDDVRVRKALNMAIDRDAFLGTLIPSDAIKATALVPPSTIGWNPDLTPTAYDPEGAKALLAEAKADGVPVDAEITLIGRTGNFPNVTEVMEALQQMLGDVGFNTKLEMYETGEWVDLYSQPFAEDRGPQLIEAMHDNAKGDPVFTMYFKYACDGLQSGMCDEKAEDLIARATAATGDERAALWKELFAYLHDDVVADVLLFHMVGFSRVSERLDFKPTINTNSELQLSQIKFK